MAGSCVYAPMSKDASLPTDVEVLQRELLHTQSVLAETAVTCEEQRTQIEKLRAELELLQRYLYGRRSERQPATEETAA